MRHPFAYFTSVWMAVLLIYGAYIGGLGFYILPAMGFIVVPFADSQLGTSRYPSDRALKSMTRAREKAYDGALVTAALAVLVVLAFGLVASSRADLTTFEFVGLTISVGIVTGYTGIVAAHELIHRSTVWARGLGWVLMSAALYSHFCVEHIMGHHPRFATPDDHATARRGEPLYFFVPRSIVQGFYSALQFRPLLIVSVYVVLAHLLVGIYVYLGLDALIFMLLQALVAIFLLETINYLEHYGLLRAKLPGGQYEAPGPSHSWDTSSIATNINTFNLGRHSMHHAFARRPFYRLQENEAAPQLPYGYATMFLIALVPPLWFRIMNRRLDEFEERRHDGAEETGANEMVPASS